MTGEERRLHKEELNDWYFIRVFKSRRIRWTGHVAGMGARTGAHRVLEWKRKGKRLLGKPRRKWEDNIKI